eukprot:scpid101737/ scgid4540/ 
MLVKKWSHSFVTGMPFTADEVKKWSHSFVTGMPFTADEVKKAVEERAEKLRPVITSSAKPREPKAKHSVWDMLGQDETKRMQLPVSRWRWPCSTARVVVKVERGSFTP